MGMPYALIKKSKPEVFNLGKGTVTNGYGWMNIFGRSFGEAWPHSDPGLVGDIGETFKVPGHETLVKLLNKHDREYSGDPKVVADRIIRWAGDDEVYLINYWEELEDGDLTREEIDKQFSDTEATLDFHLIEYKETGSIWE